nr:antirestriction protein ArdA [Intestinimonas butyriciproducens]
MEEHGYEEWFITDYDCYVDGLYDKLGEYESLDELNYQYRRWQLFPLSWRR